MSKRDQVIGSATWGRMVETLIFLEQEDENASSRRTMSILPRNGKDEVLAITLDQENRPIEAPPAESTKEIWKKLLDWVRSDASGIKPGDEFTVKQVAAAFPDLKYDTVQKTLKRLVKYEANNLERTEHAYRRKPAEPDPFEGQI